MNELSTEQMLVQVSDSFKDAARSLEQASQTLLAPEPPPKVLDEDGDEIDPRLLVLGIEKFKQPGRKFYRLIWIMGLAVWPCAEDETEFRRKAEAVAAGEVLVARYKPRAFHRLTR